MKDDGFFLGSINQDRESLLPMDGVLDGDDMETPEEDCKTLGTEKDVLEEKGKSLGVKAIGPWGSFYFIINQIYGPGVLAIPIVFQQSGLVVTTITLTFFLFVSCLSATMLCEAIALIPDNSNFEKRIEYGSVVHYYFGKRWHFVFQIFLNFTIQAYLIASIVICAQSLDQFLLYLPWPGKTVGLQFYPWHEFGFHSYDTYCSVYQPAEASLILSIGYILIMILVIPMGMINLDSNVAFVQSVSFWSLAFLMTEFVISFFTMHPEPSRVPMFGESYTQISSVFIFSWAYVMFIPSWINEKEEKVSINKAVWSSGITSFIGYFLIGLLAAWAYADISVDNVLSYMTAGPKGTSCNAMCHITAICAYLFSLGVIAPGIPVCSITTRYNLYVGKICGKKMSYFWGVIAPWLVGWIFSQGAIFADLLNWSSLIFNGIVNFVVPMFLYWRAMKSRHNREHGSENMKATPDWFRRRSRILTLVIIAMTMVLVFIQIGMDIKNPDLLADGSGSGSSGPGCGVTNSTSGSETGSASGSGSANYTGSSSAGSDSSGSGSGSNSSAFLFF